MSAAARIPDWSAMLAWLAERVDTDERVALAAADHGDRWRYSNGRIWPSDESNHPGPLAAGDAVDLDDEHGQHIARHDPRRELDEVAAKRAMLADWQRSRDTWTGLYDRPAAELHADRMHPDYEYATTEGQRKAWYDIDVPPEGDGWERNTAAGRNGWERFDYTEESYWRRLLPEGERGRREPEPPRHIRHLTTAYRHEPGYRPEWAPE